ncbi:MAG: hypothetical protein ACREFP_04730 [Acetobacteraceae bacterium]
MSDADFATTAQGAGRLQSFAASLLTERGALVEPVAPATLEVLAPPAIQEKLGLPEFCRLHFGPTAPPGALHVGLEADWLDRFARLLGTRGQTARHVFRSAFRPPDDPARLLAASFVLDNATYRLLDSAPAWTRLLLFEFRFTATADEKHQGLLRLALNLANAALIDDLPSLPATADLPADLPPDLPAGPDPMQLRALLSHALATRLDVAVAPFLESLHRRRARDQERLYAFHNDLHREAARRLLAFPESDPARRREESRIAAIGHEYQARIEDLSRQYALRITLAWTQTLEITLPVQRLTVQIRRRKADRTIVLDWNPLTRKLDIPSCEWSFGTAPPRLICDDALHLLSTPGLAPCPACSRPFCRVCHPARCPKCGHAAEQSPVLSGLPLS